jgi:S-adenosylmethionine/arginine decarboxylase-like enzyme
MLVANLPIKKDELVAMRGGSIYQTEELSYLSQEYLDFAVQMEEDLFLVPDSSSTLEENQVIRHSCRPNLGFSGQMGIVAMRDIMPGEELTIDYAMAHTRMAPANCDCGDEACRGTIHGDDHMHPDVRSRYRGYFPAWLERSHSVLAEGDSYFEKFNATGAWGLVTALDLHDCDPDTIRSAEKIHEFTVELCERIGVNRFGDPVIVHFGEDERVAGYSLVQLIETSLVSGHFANLTNRVYLDIFSCAYYDPEEVTRFASDFFGAKRHNQNVYLRY